MSKILITGATGFIGTHLIKLLQERHKLVLLSRSNPDPLSENGIEWYGIDLSKSFDFSILPDKIDVIIHLAQSKFYRHFPDKAGDIFNVNVQGTFNLLEYARCAKAETFIYASTGSVYGHGPQKFIETDKVNPLDFYGISKCIGELLIESYKTFFRTVIFRFFSVYGPGEEKMLISRILKKVRQKETVTIEGNPGLRINPIYVGDAIRVCEAALYQPVSGIINVAGDEVVTIRELVELMEAAVGRKASIQHLNDKGPGNLVGDNSQMKEFLNVLPKVNLSTGLRKMLSSVQAS